MADPFHCVQSSGRPIQPQDLQRPFQCLPLHQRGTCAKCWRENQVQLADRERGNGRSICGIVQRATQLGTGPGRVAKALPANLIPGIGPFVAGGTLMALLASAGAGAAVGTILGALVGLGVPEDEASYYESEFKTGRTIVTVRADDRSTEAWNVLIRHGAYDYERRNDAATVAGTGLQATPY